MWLEIKILYTLCVCVGVCVWGGVGVCVCLCISRSVVPDCLLPHGLPPIRLLCPWDSPGKDTGVGWHVLQRYPLLHSKPHKSALTWKRRQTQDSVYQTRVLTSTTGHVNRRTSTSFEGLQLEGSCIGGLPCGSADKESACNARDVGLILGLGRSPLEKGKATHSSILTWRIPRTV